MEVETVEIDEEINQIEREESAKLATLKAKSDLSETDALVEKYTVLSTDFVWDVAEQFAELLWNAELDKAEILVGEHRFSSLIMHVFYSEISLFRFNLIAVNDKYEQEATSRLEELESIANTLFASLNPGGTGLMTWLTGSKERKSELNEAETRILVESAAVLGFVPLCYAALAIRAGTKTSMIKAAYYMRKSYRAFEMANGLVEKYKHVVCDVKLNGTIQLAIGIFLFVVSIIPATLKWLVELIGFRGDRGMAMIALESARKSGTPLRVEATLAVAVIAYFFQDDKDGAMKLLGELDERFPQSPLMQAYIAGMSRLQGDCTKAIEQYNVAITHAKDRVPQLCAALHYHRGACHYLLNHWEEARENLEYFRANNTGKQFQSYCAFMLAVSMTKLGESDEKIEVIQKECIEKCRPNQSFDAFARRHAEQWLQTHAFTPFQLIYLPAYGLHQAQQYENCLKSLKAAVPLLQANKNEENRDEHALYYWLRGSALKGLKRFEKAKLFLQKAADQIDYLHEEKYAAMYALAELGEIAFEEGDHEEAVRLWNLVRTFSDYDWEKLLANRINANFDKLERKTQVIE